MGPAIGMENKNPARKPTIEIVKRLSAIKNSLCYVKLNFNLVCRHYLL
jgi:hypothetical protein